MPASGHTKAGASVIPKRKPAIQHHSHGSATDLGTTFTIEEGQSDWQNDIRRAGGARDPKQYMEVFDRLEALQEEI